MGTSFDSHAHKSFTEKDEQILSLKEKNISLETKLLELEENLRAKEELVRARTEAVTLMSADFSARGKSTLDQLEDTRTEMKQMQRNFADKEREWQEKNEVLKVELENKNVRIQVRALFPGLLISFLTSTFR